MLGLLLISKGFTITTMRVDKKCRPAQRYNPRHHATLRPTPRGMHARSGPMCGWQHGAHGRHRAWQQTTARPEPCAAPRRPTASVARLAAAGAWTACGRGTRYVLCVMYGLLIALYAGSFIWDAARDKASRPPAHARHARTRARARAQLRLRFSWQ